MKAIVFALCLCACAATEETSPPPVGAPVGAPQSCDNAVRLRDLACDSAKTLCAMAEREANAANADRCSDGRRRCDQQRLKVGDLCAQGVSASRPTKAK